MKRLTPGAIQCRIMHYLIQPKLPDKQGVNLMPRQESTRCIRNVPVSRRMCASHTICRMPLCRTRRSTAGMSQTSYLHLYYTMLWLPSVAGSVSRLAAPSLAYVQVGGQHKYASRQTQVAASTRCKGTGDAGGSLETPQANPRSAIPLRQANTCGGGDSSCPCCCGQWTYSRPGVTCGSGLDDNCRQINEHRSRDLVRRN